VDPKCRIFQEKWKDENFCVSVNGKALYLICNESIPVLKQYNIATHYSSKHKEKYENCVSALKEKKWCL
jgi:hypothetical protein